MIILYFVETQYNCSGGELRWHSCLVSTSSQHRSPPVRSASCLTRTWILAVASHRQAGHTDCAHARSGDKRCLLYVRFSVSRVHDVSVLVETKHVKTSLSSFLERRNLCGVVNCFSTVHTDEDWMACRNDNTWRLIVETHCRHSTCRQAGLLNHLGTLRYIFAQWAVQNYYVTELLSSSAELPTTTLPRKLYKFSLSMSRFVQSNCLDSES